MKDKLLTLAINLDIWLAERVHMASNHRIGDCHALMMRAIDRDLDAEMPIVRELEK